MKIRLKLIGLFLAVIVIAAAALVWTSRKPQSLTITGIVTTDEVQVSSPPILDFLVNVLALFCTLDQEESLLL